MAEFDPFKDAGAVAVAEEPFDPFKHGGAVAVDDKEFDPFKAGAIPVEEKPKSEMEEFLSTPGTGTGQFNKFLQSADPTMGYAGAAAIGESTALDNPTINSGEDFRRAYQSPIIPIPKPENKGIISGAIRGAANLLEGLETPENAILMSGIAGAPAVLQKLAGAGFTAMMGKNAAEKGKEIYDNADKMTAGEIAEKSVEILGEAGMAALGGKHLFARPKGGGSTPAERPYSLQPDGANMAARENVLRTAARGVDENGNLLPEKVEGREVQHQQPDIIDGLVLTQETLAREYSNASPERRTVLDQQMDDIDTQLLRMDRNAVAEARGRVAARKVPQEAPPETSPSVPSEELPPPEQSVGPAPSETPPPVEPTTEVKPAEPVAAEIDPAMAKAAQESAERIADQVTQGQPTAVREAARDAAMDNAMSSMRGGKSPNVGFMRQSAKEAAGKTAERQGESLDAPQGESEQTKLETTPAPAPRAENTELLSAMDKAIGEALPERDARILNGFKEGRTLDDIAAEHGLSGARVGQIVKAALPKLKKALEDAGFTKEDYMGGPGAMGPVEAMEMKLKDDSVSIANEDVNLRRAREGNLRLMDEERKANPKTWAEAEDLLEKDPSFGSRLVDDIRSGKKKSLTDVEQAALIHEAVTIKNARDMEAERAVDPTGDDASRAQAREDWKRYEDRLNEIDQATKLAGTSAGRALQIRKMQISENFTYEGIARRERMVKGRGLTPEESIKIQEQADKIAETQKQAEELRTKDENTKTDAEASRMIEATINELGKGYLRDAETGRSFDQRIVSAAERIVKGLENQATAALKRIRARRAEGRLNSLPVEDLVDYSIVGAAKIARSGLDFGKWSAAMVKDLGEMSADVLKQVYDASNARLDDLGNKTGVDAEKVKRALRPKAEKTPVQAAAAAKAEKAAGEELSQKTISETVRAVIKSGIHGDGPIFKEVHRLLSEEFPNVSEREMRKAYVDYGHKIEPSKEAIKVEEAELRQIVKIREDINRETERAQGVIDPKTGKLIGAEKQGFQRPKPTLPVRELMKERAELLKKRTPGDEEAGKLASRDEAKQTALRNRIEELDKQLKTGEKSVVGKPAPDSVKTEQLRAELDAMREKLKELEDAANPGETEAEKQVEALTKVRDRLNDTLSGKRPVNAPKDWNPLSAAAEDLKAEIHGMQELAAQLKRDAKPPTDPNARAEKLQIRALEDAIRKYEDKLASGDFSTAGKRQGPATEKVAALQDIRNARRKAYEAAKKAGQPIITREERYNATRLEAAQKRLAELEAMKANAFTKPATVDNAPVKLSKETLSALAKVETLKREVDMHVKEQELKNRPLWKKALSQLNQVRGVILGSDVGVLTRQGLFAWSRPATAIKATANALKAAVSPEAMGRWEAEVREREINGEAAEPIRKKAGLQMTDTLNHPEELVITRLLSRIPDFNVGGKTVRLSAVGKTLERFQTTFINSVRADLLDSAIKKGYSPEELKDRASFINSATGRSNVKHVPAAMQAIFTSPRYEISRWETLAAPITNLGKLVRSGVKGELNRGALANLQDIGVTAAGALALFMIAQKAGGYQVNWNPTSTDFLKMRKGNDVWDVSAGLAPRLRDVMRLFVALTHPDYKNNIGKVLVGSLLRTINPAIKTPVEEGSISAQKLRGQTPKSPFNGFRTPDEQHGLIALAPLIVQSTLQALKEEGIGSAAWAAAREFVGTSVNRYPKPSE